MPARAVYAANGGSEPLTFTVNLGTMSGHKLLVEVTVAAAASNFRVYMFMRAWSEDDAETAAVCRSNH